MAGKSGGKKNIVIRPAVATDIIKLWHLLKAYFDLNEHWPRPVETNTIAWGLSVIARDGCIVATLGDRIIGSVGMEIGCWPWNPAAKYLNGVWFYVDPEFRAGGTANQLIKAAKAVADHGNMPLRLDNVWGVDPEMQDRWRQAHGLIYLGGNLGYFPAAKAGDPGNGKRD